MILRIEIPVSRTGNVNETLPAGTTLNAARVCRARMRISVSLGFHFATERHFAMSRASTNSNFEEVQSLGSPPECHRRHAYLYCSRSAPRRSRCDNISCQHKHGFENFAPSRITLSRNYSCRLYLCDGSHFRIGTPECTPLQKFVSLRDILASGAN